VESWILRIELDVEWEECRFSNRSEALAAFLALTADYRSALERAMLFAAPSTEAAEPEAALRVN
jgi:hypothetical protein